MKNTGKITIILLVFAAFSSTCVREDENHHKTIRFVNKSNIPIYIYGSYSYPDTLNNRLGSSYHLYRAEANTENTSALRRRDFWEVTFRNIPSDTLMVYVFDAELVDSHSTHGHNTIIRRYDLSLQDLQLLDWTLYYPPTVAMKDIKMWPPYGSD